MALAIFIATPLFVSPARTRQGPKSGSFRERYAAISRRLGAIKKEKGWRPEMDKPLLDALERLTTREIERRLNARPAPRPEVLSARLSEELLEAEFGRAIRGLRVRAAYASPASALRLRVPGPGPYVVGFVILDDGTSRVVLDGFKHEGSGYVLAARTGEELDGHSLRLAPLRGFHKGQMRFLAYGTAYNDNHRRLECAEYGFNGLAFRKLWGRSGLFEGTVKVKGQRVVLYYQDFGRFSRETPPYFVREIYAQTRRGLKLLSRSMTGPPPSPTR